MMNRTKIALLGLFLLARVAPLFGQGPPPAPAEFDDSILGFRYIPPANMFDLTSVDKQSIQQRAARGTTKILTLLLPLRSGPDDTAADWHTVGIETYPREEIATPSDHDASRIFSRRVAGIGMEIGEPSDLAIGNFQFVVSTFELREGQLTKHARIYTTVCDGRMLAFAFSANSLDVLNRIVASMKSFGPLEHR